jgi:hypothetical protein
MVKRLCKKKIICKYITHIKDVDFFFRKTGGVSHCWDVDILFPSFTATKVLTKIMLTFNARN